MKFCTVDTFTERLFYGNPAAVCVVDSFPDDALMKSIALEVNIPVTSFVFQRDPTHFDIRWFTPLAELKLCGHGTLAAAHVIWNELKMVPSQSTIYFESVSGVLPVQNMEKGITLNFPAFEVSPASIPHGLAESLGVTPVFVGRSATNKIFVELRSHEEVSIIDPDMVQLAEIDCEGIIVTAEGGPSQGIDFVSRYFNPRKGINEDAASGAAHCCLGTYWGARLGKNDFVAQQLSKRGGILYLQYIPDRMLISGKAVTAFSGKFLGVQNELQLR